jgi:hypothetical protein
VLPVEVGHFFPSSADCRQSGDPCAWR